VTADVAVTLGRHAARLAYRDGFARGYSHARFVARVRHDGGNELDDRIQRRAIWASWHREFMGSHPTADLLANGWRHLPIAGPKGALP